MIARRGFLAGLGLTLASPSVIRTPGRLMKVRPVETPIYLNGVEVFPYCYAPLDTLYFCDHQIIAGAEVYHSLRSSGTRAFVGRDVTQLYFAHPELKAIFDMRNGLHVPIRPALS
jgi:hypothetical protein